MKGIFKLFPVALATVALASCSSDDLQAFGSDAGNYEFSKNDLLVTVDGGNDVMRAAFGEAQVTLDGGKTGMVRSLFFTAGDQIKLYDDDNWRPQTFDYNASATVAANRHRFTPGEDVTDQTSVFTLSTTSPVGTAENQYNKGYGVYPAAISEFQGELRTTINFDLSSLAFIDGDALASVTFDDFNSSYTEKTGGTKVIRKTAIPMWGNLGKDASGADVAGALTLKYLTGFLRIGVQGVAPLAPHQRAWLVIQSTNKALHGQYRATGFDYTAKAAPVLTFTGTAPTGTAATKVYANATANAAAAGGTDQNGNAVATLAANGSGVIVMKLPTLAVGDNNAIYVPLPADAAGYALKVDLVYDNAATEPTVLDLTTGATNLLNETSFKEIDVNGKFYNLDTNVEANINTPYQLAQKIEEYDQIGRTISFSVSTAPVVKGNETPQDQNLFVDIDHDITVNLTNGIESSAVGADNYNHTPALYISKKGTGKLTLNFNGGTTIPVIVLKADGQDTGDYTKIKSSKVLSDVIIGGTATLPKVIVETGAQNLVTLKADATVVNLKGKMTIDALNKTITTLNVKAANSEVALNNGTITDVVNNKTALTINSKGKSFIGTFSNPTLASAANVDTWENATPAEWAAATASATLVDEYTNVTLNSEWDGTNYTAGDFTQQANIHTAAQFSEGGYVANSILRTNLKIGKTLDGTAATDAQKQWAGKDLDQNFDGAGKTIELVTNYNGANNIGLFKDIKMAGTAAPITIKHFTLKADVEPADLTAAPWYRANIGALAGTVTGGTGANIITISRITLDAANKVGYFTTKANYTTTAGSNIGGMVGYAAGLVNIENSTAAGKVAGFANLGGYIGQVAAGATINFGKSNITAAANAETAAQNADNTAFAGVQFSPSTSVVEFEETRTIGSNLYNANYGTVGMFVGNAATATAATINIHTNSSIAANDKIDGKENNLLFEKNHLKVGTDAIGNDMYYNYSGSYQNVIGYSPAGTGTAPTVTIGNGVVTGVEATFNLSERLNNQSTIPARYFNWFAPAE